MTRSLCAKYYCIIILCYCHYTALKRVDGNADKELGQKRFKYFILWQTKRYNHWLLDVAPSFPGASSTSSLLPARQSYLLGPTIIGSKIVSLIDIMTLQLCNIWSSVLLSWIPLLQVLHPTASMWWWPWGCGCCEQLPSCFFVQPWKHLCSGPRTIMPVVRYKVLASSERLHSSFFFREVSDEMPDSPTWHLFHFLSSWCVLAVFSWLNVLIYGLSMAY